MLNSEGLKEKGFMDLFELSVRSKALARGSRIWRRRRRRRSLGVARGRVLVEVVVVFGAEVVGGASRRTEEVSRSESCGCWDGSTRGRRLYTSRMSGLRRRERNPS